jgi:hypothetical protein
MRGTETERKSQTELQTGLFVPILIQPKRLISFGGRTRTRTLDPLIKSLHYYIELTMVFSQLGQKVILRQQSVTSDFPTAKTSRWRTTGLADFVRRAMLTLSYVMLRSKAAASAAPEARHFAI